jgi:hypothetical protein
MSIRNSLAGSVTCFGLLFAASASAEELTGVVRVLGSSMNVQTMLAPTGSEKGPVVCANEVGKKVKRLGAMTVKATGDWKMNKKGEKSCFEAVDFAVVKTSSGRDALVGTLAQKESVYVVTGADGKAHVLEDIPSGLKKLDGQRVILDIKPISSPTAKGEVFKVVSYAAHP